ncbi:tripartite tricarboxylate transporter TctB family protein [Psychrobacillus sp. FJAT-51614]|uniref:Tripartite tricarboxylate transporter TctB family protein n=1 Tax=Psychrobacillus mangrovi TaxID=3117745 RepID=A0ABU8F436_9BACI
MVSKYHDIYSGFFLLIVSAIIFITTFSFKALTTSKIGPDFMPKIIAVLIGAFSIIIIVNGYKRMKAMNNEKHSIDLQEVNVKEIVPEDEKESYAPVIITLGLMIGYIVLMPFIGFLIMTSLYLFFQMMVLSHKSNRKNGLFILISVVTSIVIYYVFRSIFYVMLPTGIMG